MSEITLATPTEVLNHYMEFQEMMADSKLNGEYVADKGAEMIQLFFEMLYQTDDPSIFRDPTMQDMLFDYFADIFDKEEDVQLQQQILNALYEVGKTTSNYNVLERALVLLTTFRNKNDYLQLVGDLGHVGTNYQALKIIKTTSLYYLVHDNGE